MWYTTLRRLFKLSVQINIWKSIFQNLSSKWTCKHVVSLINYRMLSWRILHPYPRNVACFCWLRAFHILSWQQERIPPRCWTLWISYSWTLCVKLRNCLRGTLVQHSETKCRGYFIHPILFEMLKQKRWCRKKYSHFYSNVFLMSKLSMFWIRKSLLY